MVGEQPERTYFAQLAGAGLDSRAIELVDWPLKKKIGPLAHIVAGLKAMGEAHPQPRHLRTERNPHRPARAGRQWSPLWRTHRVFPDADFATASWMSASPRKNWPGLFRCGFYLLPGAGCRRRKLSGCAQHPSPLSARIPHAFEVDGELAGSCPPASVSCRWPCACSCPELFPGDSL